MVCAPITEIYFKIHKIIRYPLQSKPRFFHTVHGHILLELWMEWRPVRHSMSAFHRINQKVNLVLFYCVILHIFMIFINLYLDCSKTITIRTGRCTLPWPANDQYEALGYAYYPNPQVAIYIYIYIYLLNLFILNIV